MAAGTWSGTSPGTRPHEPAAEPVPDATRGRDDRGSGASGVEKLRRTLQARRHLGPFVNQGTRPIRPNGWCPLRQEVVDTAAWDSQIATTCAGERLGRPLDCDWLQARCLSSSASPSSAAGQDIGCRRGFRVTSRRSGHSGRSEGLGLRPTSAAPIRSTTAGGSSCPKPTPAPRARMARRRPPTPSEQ